MGILWNRSGIVERYADDLRASGAMAFFFLGGTTTPMTVFKDAGESSAHPTPLLADADGRWPDVFIPYTNGFDFQVKSADGVQLTYTINVPNPNPVDTTVVVDPANTVQTGMIHAELVNTVKSGFVRLNGRTIGSATASPPATERGNADTQNLFTYLWNNLPDSIAPVSGGRGVSAAADFSPGNKTIVLPDMRGAGFAGLDDMGSTAAGAFAGLTFTQGNTITAGSLTGINGVTLTIANMPTHAHGGTTSTESATHTHSLTVTGTAVGTSGIESATHTHTISGTTGNDSPDHTHNVTAVQVIAGGLFTGNASQLLTTNTFATSGASVRHQHPFSGTTGADSVDHTHSINVPITASGTAGTESTTHTHTFTTDSQGSGVSFNNLGLTRLCTWFIKL